MITIARQHQQISFKQYVLPPGAARYKFKSGVPGLASNAYMILTEGDEIAFNEKGSH
jgi:hypothetical protein